MSIPRGVCAFALVVLMSACADAPDGDVASAGDERVAHNTLTAEEEAAGWELLFDGESLDRWRGYGRDDLPETWIARDGEMMLQTEGGNMDGGDLVTIDHYTDFELVFDFKVGPSGNSGVFYRAREVEGKGLWQVAPEYQVLDDPAYPESEDWDPRTHRTGENYDLQAAEYRIVHPVGEWNTGRIVVLGHHVEHWLNGELVVEYDLYSTEWESWVAASKFSVEEHFARAPSGAIGLQDHGTPVWYRNVKIRPLETHALLNGRDLDGWTVHGTELWYVENGELVCESGPDEAYWYLRTDRSYEDFELTLEFLQEADGNSGVFFRSTIDGVRITGWQAEVAPPGLFTGGIYESYGRGWLVQPEPELDAALRMGEWNEMRLRVVGDQVTTWINGTRMVHLVDEGIGAGRGHIALQIHDGGGIKVRWRNLLVTEL